MALLMNLSKGLNICCSHQARDALCLRTNFTSLTNGIAGFPAIIQTASLLLYELQPRQASIATSLSGKRMWASHWRCWWSWWPYNLCTTYFPFPPPILPIISNITIPSDFKQQISTKFTELLSHLPPFPPLCSGLASLASSHFFLLTLRNWWGRSCMLHLPSKLLHRLLTTNSLNVWSISEQKTASVQRLKRTWALLHKYLVSFYSSSSLPLWATYFLDHQPIRRRCWEGNGLPLSKS